MSPSHAKMLEEIEQVEKVISPELLKSHHSSQEQMESTVKLEFSIQDRRNWHF